MLNTKRTMSYMKYQETRMCRSSVLMKHTRTKSYVSCWKKKIDRCQYNELKSITNFNQCSWSLDNEPHVCQKLWICLTIRQLNQVKCGQLHRMNPEHITRYKCSHLQIILNTRNVDAANHQNLASSNGAWNLFIDRGRDSKLQRHNILLQV